MGRLNRDQRQFFYSFCLEEAVPEDHPVRGIAAVLDLSWVHSELAPFYSKTGRPSIDPELMIRMLVLGYVFAIRSERALCRDVQVNFAYRWFCGLSIEDKIPDHSAFSRARHERFRDSGMFRRVFERVVEACIAARLVGGEGFAVDASLIVADANKQRSIPGAEWKKTRDSETASRAMREYLATLNDAAFGAASEVTPKFVSPSDPAAQWTGAMRGPAFFAYADNYLIDVKFGIINEKKITPHIPVIDKSGREDGTLSRQDFRFDQERNVYVCPQGKLLHTTGYIHDGVTLLYRASKSDCSSCPLKPRCCPKSPQRKVPRSIHEDARDVARALASTTAFEQSRRDRKRVEMLFAHLKRILKLGRLRLRGPCGAQDEFTLAAIAQNLRRLAKLIPRPPPAVAACLA